MNDVARALVAEDGVVLVLAVHGKAARSALLEADELLVPEVPAARALVEVAADRSLIANLRCADETGSVEQRGVKTPHLCVRGEVDDPDGRSDLQAAVGRGGDRPVERALHVDNGVGLRDV